MTREAAWVSFASAALAQAMSGVNGESVGIVEVRAALAAKWADAMTIQWLERFGSAAEEPPRRRKAG